MPRQDRQPQPSPPPRPAAAARLSRRALLAAGAFALLAACRGGSAGTATESTPVSRGSQSPATRPAPTGAASPQPTTSPSTAPGTPQVTGPQVFYQWGFANDPVSHDFNANRYCGGEPELWAGLLTLTPDLEPVADWAEAWSASSDGLTWTFRLRPNNRGWSNGDPVTAHDFVWSWQRKLAPETAAPDAPLLYDIVGAREIHTAGAPPETLGARATDDWTLDVALTGPRPRFLVIIASVAGFPAHRPSVERYGERWTEAGNCVSNGPFLLTRWEHGVAFEIARNPNYWDAARVTLDRCITPILPLDLGLRPYDDRQVDYIAVARPDLPVVRNSPNLSRQLGRTVEAAVWCLIPQVTVPPFDDVRVRQAISRAIDRERIVQITEGRAHGATSLMPVGMPGHFDDAEIVQIQQFDVDAALAHLDDTPFAGGQNWPPLTLTMRRSDPDAELIANDVISQLRENLGLNLSLDILEPDDFEAAVQAHQPALIWLRWWFHYPDPHNGYGDLFAPEDPLPRRLAWEDPTYTDLVRRAREESDPAARLDLYRQCEQTLQNAAVYIPVAYPVTWYLFKPWVTGIPTNSQGDWLPRGELFTRMKARLRIENRPEA